MKNLEKDMDFILEMNKMKSIQRETRNLTNDRRENDAEHSFYVTIMAMILGEYADKNIDINKVIKMMLIHDLVEIDAGDTFAYDEEGYKSKYDREQKAANRIFALLSPHKEKFYKDLYNEFEDCQTEEAKFANLIDRINPMILNYFGHGGTWKTHNIPREKVLGRIENLKDSSEEIFSYVKGLIDNYFSKEDIE